MTSICQIYISSNIHIVVMFVIVNLQQRLVQNLLVGCMCDISPYNMSLAYLQWFISCSQQTEIQIRVSWGRFVLLHSAKRTQQIFIFFWMQHLKTLR